LSVPIHNWWCLFQVMVFFTTARLTGLFAEIFLKMGLPILELHSKKSQPVRYGPTLLLHAAFDCLRVLCSHGLPPGGGGPLVNQLAYCDAILLE